MGWFGGKSNHTKQVVAMTNIVLKLCERTLYPVRGDAPSVLQFQLPDSRYRYLIFCLSTVHAVCARRMKNPDAVLNECAHNLIRGAIADAGEGRVFEEPVEPQKAGNEGMACLDDFLHRWSAYIDIRNGRNTQAATSLVCSMLRDTESLAPAAAGDGPRLWSLARWIEDRFEEIDQAFVELGG